MSSAEPTHMGQNVQDSLSGPASVPLIDISIEKALSFQGTREEFINEIQRMQFKVSLHDIYDFGRVPSKSS